MDYTQFSMLEVAYKIMEEKTEPCNIFDLMKEVLAAKGINDETGEIEAQLYIDITTSSKFVYEGDDKWDLKIRRSLDDYDKDGTAFVKDIIDDSDDDKSVADFDLDDKSDDDDDDDDQEEVSEEYEYEDEEEFSDDDDSDDEVGVEVRDASDDDDFGTDDDDFDEDDYNEKMDDFEDLYDK